MGSPVIKSHKIRSKQQLNTYLRDVYAGYSFKTHVPLSVSTRKLHEASSVNMRLERGSDRKGLFWRAFVQKKPERFMAMSHPVWMERKQKEKKYL